MNKLSLQNSLIKLMSVLGSLHQEEVGWLYSSIRHSVNYPNPQDRIRIQDRLNHATGGVLVVYLFALFETYFEKNDWNEYLKPDELEKLLAFRHIRHSIAHGFNGTRADGHRTEFDRVMSSPTTRITGVKKFDNDSITLAPEVGIQCLDYMKDLSQKCVARVANQNILMRGA